MERLLGAPRIEIMGYAGDGIGGFNDTTAVGTLLATHSSDIGRRLEHRAD